MVPIELMITRNILCEGFFFSFSAKQMVCAVFGMRVIFITLSS